jgi:DNA invertase Pin-like site-specific DNA recombinase
MKRAVLYLRVSTIDQTTANQERELREIAFRGDRRAGIRREDSADGAIIIGRVCRTTVGPLSQC